MDKEFLKLKCLTEEFNDNLTGLAMGSEFVPIFRLVAKKQIEKLKKITKERITIFKEIYNSHQNDYQDGVIRDFTDALTYAKNDALQNEKESAPYLTDSNLALFIFDLFGGNYLKGLL